MNKMKFKEILIWLMIFIIGSLIVYWIIGGGINRTYYKIKDNFQENRDNIQLDYQNFKKEEIIEEPNSIPIKSNLNCVIIENTADIWKTSSSEVKKTLCLNECSLQKMRYSKFRCKDGILECYCQKNERR